MSSQSDGFEERGIVVPLSAGAFGFCSFLVVACGFCSVVLLTSTGVVTLGTRGKANSKPPVQPHSSLEQKEPVQGRVVVCLGRFWEDGRMGALQGCTLPWCFCLWLWGTRVNPKSEVGGWEDGSPAGLHPPTVLLPVALGDP